MLHTLSWWRYILMLHLWHCRTSATFGKVVRERGGCRTKVSMSLKHICPFWVQGGHLYLGWPTLFPTSAVFVHRWPVGLYFFLISWGWIQNSAPPLCANSTITVASQKLWLKITTFPSNRMEGKQGRELSCPLCVLGSHYHKRNLCSNVSLLSCYISLELTGVLWLSQ